MLHGEQYCFEINMRLGDKNNCLTNFREIHSEEKSSQSNQS